MSFQMERQVATTQTPTKDPLEKQAPQDDPLEQGNGLDQSVYIADLDTIGVYPLSMSNDEIDYNIQTEVRGKTPEEYYVNFLPLKAIQDGFKFMFDGGVMGAAVDAGIEAGKKVAEYQDETITPAFKYAVTGDLEKAYKPWIELVKEAHISDALMSGTREVQARALSAGFVGKNSEISNEEFMATAPTALAVIPWFMSEFMPESLLEFGTKPLNWVGAYGIEKFGPPIINKAIQSKINQGATQSVKNLFKKIFDGEKSLKAEFDVFGLKINARQSDLDAAYKNARTWSHPDRGGAPDGSEFVRVQNAYKKIMETRGKSVDAIFDFFRDFQKATPAKRVPKLLLGESGAIITPKPGDLVRVGEEFGKLLKVSGKIAIVNIAGKVSELPIDQLEKIKEPSDAEKYSKTPEARQELLSKLQKTMPEAKTYLDTPEIITARKSQSEIQPTIKINTPERKEMRRVAAEAGYGTGAKKKENRVDIIMGPPGAGKSELFVKPLIKKHGALEIDADLYKPSFPEYQGGKHAGAVHAESVEVFYEVVKKAVQNNDNIVLPVVGKGLKTLKETISLFESQGYDIHLHSVQLSPDSSASRAVERFKEKGRFVDPLYILDEVGLLPSENYGIVKTEKGVRSYEEYSNEVERGQKPRLLERGESERSVSVHRGQASGGSKVSAKEKESAVNPSNLKIDEEARQKLTQATQEIRDKIENQTGQKMTHEEVIEKAKEVDILTAGVSREATLEFQASLLKTRQHLAALAEENELTPEFLDALRITANLGTDIARNLESFKIEALPEHATTKMKIIKDLIKLGKSSKEILAASKGVDFTKEQSVAEFYRKFVKPTLPELLDEYVYMNILSSPVTHITNAFSNALQLAGINPLTKLASGSIDLVASSLFGKDRKHYLSEIGDFYKGAVNALPKAVKAAKDAITGQRSLERPDLAHLPTLSKLVDVATLGVGKYVTRALEASDVFFRTMIEAGEIEALSKNLGHAPDAKELAKIKKEAIERANYYVFRKKPDEANKSGQGDLLSAIDKMTNAIYGLRKVPGMKWFIRFVQTPMNILKQGVEYSPAGFATLKGSEDKSEQAGKAMIGSMVLAGASWLAANNMTTWSAPTGAQDKNDFYAAGLQPYSVRIGDKWLSYSKLGPLAYPLAMAAALHHFSKESPNALSDTEMEKLVDALTGIMKFFSDQSYMQGVADLVGFASGQKSKAVSSAPTQLIPLSSLQGWINNIIDPLQRKAEKGLSIESIIDNIQMKIVGMSKFVPPQIDTEEVPVKKQMRGINAVSPIKVSEINPGKLAEYKDEQRTKQEMNKIKKEFS